MSNIETKIVNKIIKEQDIEPSELTLVLNDVVDVDALNRLIERSSDVADLSITFSYKDYEIVIENKQDVTVYLNEGEQSHH